ncbi:hypothetical protein BD289DRAFT_195482 [Coniella lustricola]|uniref:Uncharacterized protein n=1 Tax=Coniella lustricola TaxID=2025994 RepID=A0A2T3AMD6_9PEZI|nr:hypothetical protein BD289DRAFT_195482 [Coniella lustricola]
MLAALSQLALPNILTTARLGTLPTPVHASLQQEKTGGISLQCRLNRSRSSYTCSSSQADDILHCRENYSGHRLDSQKQIGGLTRMVTVEIARQFSFVFEFLLTFEVDFSLLRFYLCLLVCNIRTPQTCRTPRLTERGVNKVLASGAPGDRRGSADWRIGAGYLMRPRTLSESVLVYESEDQLCNDNRQRSKGVFVRQKTRY